MNWPNFHSAVPQGIRGPKEKFLEEIKSTAPVNT